MQSQARGLEGHVGLLFQRLAQFDTDAGFRDIEDAPIDKPVEALTVLPD